jgi:hypothetical protein
MGFGIFLVFLFFFLVLVTYHGHNSGTETERLKQLAELRRLQSYDLGEDDDRGS